MTDDIPDKRIPDAVFSVVSALVVVAMLILAARVALPPAGPQPSTTATEAPTRTATPTPTPTPILPSGPCGPGILKPNGVPWRCTFADDFDGTALDSSKWTPLTTAVTGLNNNHDCWLKSPYNIALRDGTLQLTTRREARPFRCTSLGGTSYQTQYSSGSVSTSGKFNQTYGLFSFRAKFPRGDKPGVMASLWMHPYRQQYGKWPNSGEIDVAEYFSQYPNRAIPFVHYKTAERDPSVTNATCMIKDPWKFHTYTAVWAPGRIVISFDDKVCLDNRINAAPPLTGSQPFDQPFSIHLSQCLGGGANQPSDETVLPATTEVDWVRIWR